MMQEFEFLEDIFDKQVKKIESYNKTLAFILKNLKKVVSKFDFDASEKINKMTESVVISEYLSISLNDCDLGTNAVTIGVLIILCMVSFLMNFVHSIAINFKKKFTILAIFSNINFCKIVKI